MPETEQALIDHQVELVAARLRIEELEAKLASWRAIVRAAVSLQQSEEWAELWNALSRDVPPSYFLALSNAVDALSEQERSEILEGGTDD